MKFAAILFLISVATLSCKEKSAPPPLSLQEFAEIYSEAVLLSQGLDSLQALARVDSLLKDHGLTRQDMEQTVAAYQKDLEKWGLFATLVEKKLEDATSLRIESRKVTADDSLKKAAKR